MGFRLAVGSGAEELSDDDYLKVVVEGANLLQVAGNHNETVFTFEQVNPFPYILSMKPLSNGYPLLYINGPVTTDPKLLPQARELFGAADFVMVPRLPHKASNFRNMMQIYGGYLSQHFSVLRDTAHWQLWKKTGVAPEQPDRR